MTDLAVKVAKIATALDQLAADVTAARDDATGPRKTILRRIGVRLDKALSHLEPALLDLQRAEFEPFKHVTPKICRACNGVYAPTLAFCPHCTMKGSTDETL